MGACEKIDARCSRSVCKIRGPLKPPRVVGVVPGVVVVGVVVGVVVVVVRRTWLKALYTRLWLTSAMASYQARNEAFRLVASWMVDVATPVWLVEHKPGRLFVMDNPEEMESKYRRWVAEGSKKGICDCYIRRGIFYDVDFDYMIQRRLDTGFVRKIWRAPNPHDSRGRFYGR